VCAFVERHWESIVRNRYSYFEVTTALAFAAFARAKVDLAVIEVGLGGRFDATNIIDPITSVITRIARDHEHVLGHTPSEIAFEKAGIIKEGVPVVIGPLDPIAEERICGIAGERHAPLWSAHELLEGRARPGFPFLGNRSLRIPLIGSHQISNLAVAIATARMIDAQGVPVSESAIRAGVARTRWPARFQIAPGKPTVVYDAGHNPDGAHAIVATWKQQFGSRRCVGVFNTRPDKNHSEMFDKLSEIVHHWVFCPMPDSPYVAPEELLAMATQFGQGGEWVESPRAAFRIARTRASETGIVLVTGSHYLVGALIPSSLINEKAPTDGGHMVTISQLLAAAKDRGAAF
jgi:dihydrofolate synthase/folylpolyglutamate synthase